MNFIFERQCLPLLSKVIYIECILLIFSLFLYIFRFLYLKKKALSYGDFLYEPYLCHRYVLKKLLVFVYREDGLLLVCSPLAGISQFVVCSSGTDSFSHRITRMLQVPLR